MPDTTQIEIIGKQLDKVVNAVTQHPTGMTSGQIALFAAAIGATAAILSQLVIFLLTKFKERGNLKKELIAEERRVAFLITEYYKELVMHKVHKQYWYRTSELHNQGTEDGKDSHNRHFASNQKGFETMNKIRETTAQYFKVVTHFTNLTGSNEIINTALKEIKSFKPRKASEFSEVRSYPELLKAQAIEEAELNKEYLFYSECFDKINIEMTARM